MFEEIGLQDDHNEARYIDHSEPETRTVYPDWCQVPKDELKTKNQWLRAFRRVRKDEDGAALVKYAGKQVELFGRDQTEDYMPRKRTRDVVWRLYDTFARCCDKDQYAAFIPSCEGYRTQIRGANIYSFGLMEAACSSHLSGKWAALKAGKMTTWVAIDLDYHSQGFPVDLWMRMAEALIGEFWGKGTWHIDAKQSLSGFHLVSVFKQPRNTKDALKSLRTTLERLDAKHPELMEQVRNHGAKTIADLEIYPSNKGFQDITCTASGCRIPLGKGTATITDEVRCHDNEVPQAEAYLDWLANPDRKYLPIPQVVQWIRSALEARLMAKQPEDDQSPEEPVKAPVKPKESLPETTEAKAESRIECKGRLKSILHRAFSQGDFQEMTFNKAFRLLCLTITGTKPEIDDEDCRRILMHHLDELEVKNHNLNSSKMEDHAEAVRQIEQLVKSRWNMPEESKEIFERCRQAFRGWDFEDVETWDHSAASTAKPIKIKFTKKATEVIESYFQPILQPTKPSKNLKDCKVFVKEILWLTECKERSGDGISSNYWKKLFQERRFNKYNIQKTQKQMDVINGLVECGFLQIRIKPARGITATHYELGLLGRECVLDSGALREEETAVKTAISLEGLEMELMVCKI